MPVQTMNGINPLDPAALEQARTLAEKAEQLKRENAPPENLVEADDLSDLPVIAGFECVRPISAGVFAVLQLIRHPFVTGEESAPEDEFSDALVFLKQCATRRSNGVSVCFPAISGNSWARFRSF